jgi:hypothetical protein
MINLIIKVSLILYKIAHKADDYVDYYFRDEVQNKNTIVDMG